MVESHHAGILILVFISSTLFVGSLTRHLLKKTNIPYTVALLAIGLLIGILGSSLSNSGTSNFLTQIIALVGQIDPKLVLFIFLPILIFESALSLDTHLFRRLFYQIITLAVPTLIVCIGLTATTIKFAFPWEWSWPVCLMFAALISATDPVAVVALLKEISSRKRLETLIEGESLLNDGTAIVFFSIFYVLVTNPALSFSLPDVVADFTFVVCTGMLIGLIVGFVTIYWWGLVFNDPMIEVSISIMSAFVAFLISEYMFHVSGVVAVVSCAIVLASFGRTKVSPEVSEFLHHFWGMMGFIAETIIFLIVGIVIGHRVGLPTMQMWMMLGALYIIIMFIRALAIGLFYPFLKRLSVGFNKANAVVLTWGGLRGVVGLTLALAAIQDPRISSELGDQILFLTAGIVVLTIAINGSTMLGLIKLLGLDKLPKAKFLTVRRAKLQIDETLRKYYPDLKKHEVFQEADWPVVETVAGIDDKIIIEDLKAEGEALLTVEESDLIAACKRRTLEIERRNYWTQLNEGLLGNTAAHILMNSVEHALDVEPIISPRKSLTKHWELPQILDQFLKFPLTRKFVLKYTFKRFTIGYELAIGFLHAQEETLKNLPAIAPDIQTRNDIIKDLEKNKKITHQHLDNMRKNFPDILSKLETYAASRSMLYKKRSIIKDLVSSGLMDENETKKMIAHVEEKMQHLNKDILNVHKE